MFAPHTINDLIAIETRADFGTFELARLYPELWSNNSGSNLKTLMSLFKHPLLWPRLFIYCYVRAIARRKATISIRNNAFIWERDQTSRGAAGALNSSSSSLP